MLDMELEASTDLFQRLVSPDQHYPDIPCSTAHFLNHTLIIHQDNEFMHDKVHHKRQPRKFHRGRLEQRGICVPG